jgi:hypothetical protein
MAEYSGAMSDITQGDVGGWGSVTPVQAGQENFDYSDPMWDNPWGQSYDLSPITDGYVGSYGGVTPVQAGDGLTGDKGVYDFTEEEEDRKSRTPGRTMGMGPKTPGFWDSGLGKVLRGVTSLHPAGRLGWAGYDLANGRNPLGVAAGFLPGAGGMLARGALDYQQNGDLGKAVGTQAGGVLGGMFGNAVAPGLGAITGQIGANMGRSIGGTPGINPNGGTPGQSQGNTNTFGVNEVLAGLGGLYSANQAGKALGQNQDALQGQISSLSSMYGPDSPYAKQLRQTLERQDARAGRNSQYGPREVQLQALLADKAASTAGTIGTLSGQSADINARRTALRNQQLGTLLGMGQRSGLFNNLSNMFNQAPAQAPEAPFIDYGEYV